MGFPLTLIVKVTRSCNLRCVYCSEWRARSPTMTISTLEALISRALEDSPSLVQFAWHGGEPTLVPLEFYRRVVEFQRRYARPEQVISSGIQTNGTLLDDRWVAFLQEGGLSVGVSLDGPPELHDKVRRTAGDRPTWRTIRGGLDRLERAGIPYGVSMVLSAEMVALGPERIWDFIRTEGFPDVDIIPVLPPNKLSGRTIAPQFITRQQWITFMQRFFDLWWESGSPIRVRILDSILRKVAGGRSGVCVIAGGCVGAAFGVEPDGTIFHCGLFQEDARYDFESITRTTFSAIRSTPKFKALVKANDQRLQRFAACSNFSLCSGGCPHDSYLFDVHGTGKANDRCCGYGELIEHVHARGRAEMAAAGGAVVPAAPGS